MPPVLPSANEKGLDRHGPGLAREREHVGVAKPFGMDRLAALDVGQRPQPVAIDGGQLIILAVRGLGHLARQARLDAGRLAGEELLRLADQLAIVFAADAPDAGRRAALDLVEQAGPRLGSRKSCPNSFLEGKASAAR